MSRYCGQYPHLVGASYWLPPDPFEFGWAAAVGCNNLRCERCGEQVCSEVLADGQRRHYACRCQQQDVVSTYQIGGESEDLYPALSGWVCDGHPDFLLPATLDGVRLNAATDWDALVTNATVRPPFEPPGVELDAVWITRLYRLLGAEQALLSQAVASLLSAEDPRLVRGAYDFFFNEREATGVERVAASVAARQEWLTAAPDPHWPSSSLLDRAALLLHRRLLVVDETGNLADRLALGVAKELAIAGVGPKRTPLTLSDHDPAWLLTYAARLARANSGWIDALIYAMTRVPAKRRKQVLRDIAEVAPERVRAAIEQHFQEPERGELLSFIRT